MPPPHHSERVAREGRRDDREEKERGRLGMMGGTGGEREKGKGYKYTPCHRLFGKKL